MAIKSSQNWQELRLAEIGRIITGKTPPTAFKEYFGGEVPFITPSDMDERRFIDHTERTLSEPGVNAVASCQIPAHSIIVSCIGSDMGKTAIAVKPSVTNQQINTIVVNPEHFFLYVYYNLCLRKQELRNLADGGSAQPILNKGHFSQLPIKVPPLPIQERIASILCALDDKIELNRKMNETLEALARALFKSWFVDFDPVREKATGRQPKGMDAATAALFPASFQDSSLGKIPKGWEVWRIADIGNIICGKTPSTQVSEYYGHDVPFITIPDMHGKIFAITTQKGLSFAGAESQQKKTLPVGAICVSCIATPGLVVMTLQQAQTNQQINTVVPARSDENYFWYWSLRNLGDEIRAGGSGGSVLANLSTGRFAELSVLSPPARLRSYYHLNVTHFFNRILANENESYALATIRDALLPKLLSGEIRVKEAEKYVEGAV